MAAPASCRMLMPIVGLNHYNLRAPRELIETLRAFYTDIVGLAVGTRPPFRSFGYWLYAGGRDVLHLTEARPDETRRIDVSTTFDHVAFDSTDCAGVEQHLSARGIAYEVDRVPQTGQVQIFFKDPAGNGVELNFSDAHA